VLAQLSVFPGGFDRDAAEGVADASPAILSGLVDKSLIRLHYSGRYDLHGLLRQFAADRLAETGQTDELARRHLSYFLGLARQAEAALFGPRQVAWFDCLEAELDNLQAALNWALHSDQAEAGLRLASVDAHVGGVAGRLGDLYGQRNLFAIGLAIFTGASALCGLAQDANQLIAARVLQGVGGAVLTPQTLAILTSLFPPERRGTAFGIWAGVAGLATLAGPTIGGAIVTYIDWRWIFFVNVPIGLLALLLTAVYVPESRTARPRRLDAIGQVLVIAALATLTSAIIEGPKSGWTSAPILALFAASVASFVALVLYELRRDAPLIEARAP